MPVGQCLTAGMRVSVYRGTLAMAQMHRSFLRLNRLRGDLVGVVCNVDVGMMVL